MSFRIATKLKVIKQEIKKWVKETGRKEEESITDLISEIDILDGEEECGNLIDTGRERKCSLKADLAKKLHMDAIFWKQKARKKWL